MRPKANEVTYRRSKYCSRSMREDMPAAMPVAVSQPVRRLATGTYGPDRVIFEPVTSPKPATSFLRVLVPKTKAVPDNLHHAGWDGISENTRGEC